MYKGWMGKK